MQARDLMQEDFLEIRDDMPLDEILELFVVGNVDAAPVIDGNGSFLGIVTQQDILFGRMTRSSIGMDGPAKPAIMARQIMTSPAICARESTEVADLARIMWKLHIHRLPIVRDGRVTGIVSSIDLCRMISQHVDYPDSAIA